MMFNNPYLAQQLARERTRNAALEAEQSRLISALSNAGKPKPRAAVVKLRWLLVFFTGQKIISNRAQ
jgi:hypothetical protein